MEKIGGARVKFLEQNIWVVREGLPKFKFYSCH
jgi:hypothetical protein